MERSFGDFNKELGYKTLDERVVRASAGLMLGLALIAFINVNFLQRYFVITYISGFLMLNFLIGILLNPKYAPTVILANLIVAKQSKLPIGAIQKKFAWTLGLLLASAIFILSLLLLNDVRFFEPVCLLCLICIALLFIESSFGICVGCNLYHFFVKIKWIKEPAIKPNCMGDSCEV
ncbi:MAG: DUF4395 domain-containing protein [Fluviicola sp.]|nr:DUF4395 domain-containing protein [Fluviicola sp.]